MCTHPEVHSGGNHGKNNGCSPCLCRSPFKRLHDDEILAEYKHFPYSLCKFEVQLQNFTNYLFDQSPKELCGGKV